MKKQVQRLAGALTVLALVLGMAPALPAAEGPIVDVNTASEEELVALPGIGPAKAKAIIEYRQSQPFGSVEDLRNVQGIGEHTFEGLKDKVRVGSASVGAVKR